MDGKTCLEAGAIALVGLERISLELRAQLEDGVVLKYVATLMSTVGVSKNVPSNCFLLHRLMVDADDLEAEKTLMDDPQYVSPIKRQETWSQAEAWKHLREILVGYGSALLCNICGRGEGSVGEGAGTAIVDMVRCCEGLAETQYVGNLLKACYGLSYKPDARLEANEAGAIAVVEEFVEKSEGKEKHMAKCVLARLKEVGWEKEVEPEGGGDKRSEFENVEEEAYFGFQRAIEGEERIHAAIDLVEGGELPPGWESAEDPSTGLRYFYKNDGSDSLWTLPSASDKILEAFYLSKE